MLAQVLRDQPRPSSERLLVGFDKADDAAVYKLSDDLALVLTVDFITPIADDPYVFGQIAAANSLSDVYAMGGQPITALSIVGFPSKKLGLEVLSEILRGGADKAAEAGAIVCGGHSVDDHEVKYGLSVTGTVHPKRIVTNSGARAGDELFLTKPLGTGIVTTAVKQGKASAECEREVLELMSQLNRGAAGAMLEASVHAATDVTGFGLLGHASEVADGSQVTLVLEAGAVPVLQDAVPFARRGILTGADGRNRRFLEGRVEVAPGVDEARLAVFFDAQTSGGLLMTVPQARASKLAGLLQFAGVLAARVGRAVERGPVALKVVP